MNENIILILCAIGYIIIAAFVTGLFHRGTGWDNPIGTFMGCFWPISIVAVIIMVIGYLPYKLAIGDFKKKKKCTK